MWWTELVSIGVPAIYIIYKPIGAKVDVMRLWGYFGKMSNTISLKIRIASGAGEVCSNTEHEEK